MKKLLVLFIPLVFFFGCSDDDENNLTWGYACINDDCFSAVNGPYETLKNCESACDNID